VPGYSPKKQAKAKVKQTPVLLNLDLNLNLILLALRDVSGLMSHHNIPHLNACFLKCVFYKQAIYTIFLLAIVYPLNLIDIC